MAKIFPFQAYRYAPEAGPLEHLVTQPYDKISPEMRTRYLSLSPYNAVRIILGERLPSDTQTENVYTRAAAYLRDWIGQGVLLREPEPCVFAYSQEFCVPDSGEMLTRMGLVALGAVEDYSEGTVHRHEQTLSGPKKDRLELLRNVEAHFGHIFMLYPDPEREVDLLLEEASRQEPAARVTDEYQTRHTLWKITGPRRIERIRELMRDKKLVIADGHHRYETALAFSRERPGLEAAEKVMMTFVNMYSPGLRILATHRIVQGLGIDSATLADKAAAAGFRVRPLTSASELRQALEDNRPEVVRIGAAVAGSDTLYLLEAARRQDELDVKVLHRDLLGRVLEIGEEAVRDEKHLRYVRGMDAAIDTVRNGSAQIAFLVKPTSVEQVARVAFSGAVMPQKSTDFFPKLLSGLTIYRL
jgi:uncharacterized protein (DUF1015 family)